MSCYIPLLFPFAFALWISWFFLFFCLMFGTVVACFFSLVCSLLSFSFSLSHVFVFCFPSLPPSPPLPACAEPSAPPQEVKCSSPSSTSLLVSWRPPHSESQNGPLVGYIVRYAVAGGGAETTEELQAPATATEITLQRLEKWMSYRVRVAAATAVGPGPESTTLTCRTDEDGTNHTPSLPKLFLGVLIYRNE